jgi:CheY-like chemotaxis protein
LISREVLAKAGRGGLLANRLRSPGRSRTSELTAYGRPQMFEQVEAGFNAHLTKPVDMAKLRHLAESPEATDDVQV